MSDRVFKFAYLYAEIYNVLVYTGHAVISIRLWPVGHIFS